VSGLSSVPQKDSLKESKSIGKETAIKTKKTRSKTVPPMKYCTEGDKNEKIQNVKMKNVSKKVQQTDLINELKKCNNCQRNFMNLEKHLESNTCTKSNDNNRMKTDVKQW
jgi:hypothetical protein